MSREQKCRDTRHLLQMQADDLTDDQAAKVPSLFDKWAVDIGYITGKRINYNNAVYEVIQNHTSQSDWTPDIAHNLYKIINADDSKGTIDDPIPAAVNMDYLKDKYYIQDDIVYLCIRDSEQPLQHLPSQLVGVYFTEI